MHLDKDVVRKRVAAQKITDAIYPMHPAHHVHVSIIAIEKSPNFPSIEIYDVGKFFAGGLEPS